MMKEIVAATLGFLTIPIVVAVIVAAVFGSKFVASYDLSSSHYWGAFGR